MAESIATSFNVLKGFPCDVFHPVYGKRSVKEFGDLARLPNGPTEWFNTAAEADAARTQPEADAVVAHNMNMRVGEHIRAAELADMDDKARASAKPADLDPKTAHVVRDSVQAQEAADKQAIAMTVAGAEMPPAGPAAPPLVNPRPGATDGFTPAPDAVAAAKSPAEVSKATREAAASEIFHEPGEKVDLAAGEKPGKK